MANTISAGLLGLYLDPLEVRSNHSSEITVKLWIFKKDQNKGHKYFYFIK